MREYRTSGGADISGIPSYVQTLLHGLHKCIRDLRKCLLWYRLVVEREPLWERNRTLTPPGGFSPLPPMEQEPKLMGKGQKSLSKEGSIENSIQKE